MLRSRKQLRGLEADPLIDIVEIKYPEQDQREDRGSDQYALRIEISGGTVGLTGHQRFADFMSIFDAERHHQKR